MAQVTVFDQDKKQAGSVTLSPEVFEVPVRAEILNLVVRSIRASWRAGTHQTLTRSMMKGGGAKPWRQKGTGRARSGSNISPVWTGGAVTFGPQPRDYAYSVPKKVRKNALISALSMKVKEEKMTILRDFPMEAISTRAFQKVVDLFGLKKALVVIDQDNVVLMKSSRNIKNVKMIRSEGINVYDVLNYEHLVLLEPSIKKIEGALLA